MNLGKRDTSLDVIRIVAIFFVLFTHTGNIGSKIYINLEPGGGRTYYAICLSLDVVRMVCVPLFLMLSGTLLLGKKESAQTLLKKRVLRILMIIIVFSFIQYYWTIKNSSMEFNGWEFIKKAYTGNIRGSYWYLYLYLAYLCLLPVLRNVAALMGKRLFFYIIIISTLVDTLGLIAYQSPDLYSSFYGYVSCVNGYAFLYPLLGFGSYNYLKHKEMGKKEYIFFIFVFLSTVCLCSWLVYNEYMVKGEYSEAHIWRFTALLSVSAYILIYDIVRRIEVPIVIK